MSGNTTNNNNNNTLGSYVDSATGAAQRTVGSVTGSGSDSTSSNTTNPQAQGSNPSWNQTLGSAKESLGNVLGNENLRRTGIEQNSAGKEAEARGQLKDLGEGVTNRAQGAVGGVGAAIKGDREEEEKWRKMHDEGKGRQRGAEQDIEQRN